MECSAPDSLISVNQLLNDIPALFPFLKGIFLQGLRFWVVDMYSFGAGPNSSKEISSEAINKGDRKEPTPSLS